MSQNSLFGQKSAKQAHPGTDDDQEQYADSFQAAESALLADQRFAMLMRSELAASVKPAAPGPSFAAMATSAATTTAATTSTAAKPTAAASTGSGSSALPSWISSLSDSTLKADMTTAAADGTISYAEMLKTFTDLDNSLSSSKTGLSASQFSDLKTIVSDLSNGLSVSSYVAGITNSLVDGDPSNASWTGGTTKAVALGNLSTGSSYTQLSELLGKWYLGTDLPNATVSMTGTKAFTVTYKAVTAPVFAVGGPSMNDVNQGDLGDCYLLSSLAEVAKYNPSLITSMIQDNGNNTFGVRFYVGGQADWVTVNNSLANGGTVFNYGTDIWASLVEKAYAQLQGSGVFTGDSYGPTGNSYSSIGNGGYPDFALQEITGATAITDYTANGGSWGKYTYSPEVPSYKASSSSGLTSSSVLSLITAALNNSCDVVLTSNTNSYDSAGKQCLVANHAMSVIGYDSKTSSLIIRNPWGTETSGQYWDTTFEVGLSQLLSAGDSLSVDNIDSTPTIAPPTLVSQTANQIWQAGKTVSFTLPAGTFVDPQGQALTYSASLANGQALPSWLSFNKATGVFSGTAPTTLAALSLMVTATDSSGLSVSETFTVSPPAAPTLAAQTAAQTWIQGGAVNFALAAGTFNDPQGAALTYTATLANGQALPSWLKFNAATLTFSGTVAVGTAAFSIKVTATDSYGLASTETFAVQTPPMAAPKLNLQTANITAVIGQAFTYTVAANSFVDPQSSAMTYTASLSSGQALPSWLKFNAATETFSGVAPANAGTATIKLTATDAYGLSTAETFSITATTPKGPVLSSQTANQTWSIGQSVNFSLPASTFSDSQAMTYSARQLLNPGDVLATGWLRFNPTTETFTGTVAANESGTLHLAVDARDATGATVTDYFDISFKNSQGLKVSAVAAPSGSQQQQSFMQLAAR